MRPIVFSAEVKASPPCPEDNTADIERLKKTLVFPEENDLSVPLKNIDRIAGNFRRYGYSGIAVMNDMPAGIQLADFLPDRPERLLAMALDLGTTRLEASLINCLDGRILVRCSRENRQTEYGGDILTRMHYAAKKGGLPCLQEAVVASFNELAAELAGKAGAQRECIRAVVVSGNTTMIHFLLGLNTHNLCRAPYVPLVSSPEPFLAAEVGLVIHPAAPVWVMPSITSYLGGDVIAGIAATGIDRDERVSMLIDVGTNVEVVLGNREWLLACSGAAGPALEDGVVRMGMRAAPGAIEHISIEPQNCKPHVQTIAGENPRGICGSGIIDLIAGLYREGIIDNRGKFRTEHCPERFRATANGVAFLVVEANKAGCKESVVLDQVDLDAVIYSKAAMYALLTTLVDKVGITFADLHRIYVAGAFGGGIDLHHAISIGMLPDLPVEIFQTVGNSSLAGAERALLDSDFRRRCMQLPGRITCLELNSSPEFVHRFMQARFIPHADTSLFPSGIVS